MSDWTWDKRQQRVSKRAPQTVRRESAGSTAAPPSAQTRSDRLNLRRGLGYLGMTLVLPGSAQLTRGHRSIGRWAIRVWGALIALLLVWLLLLGIDQGTALGLLGFGPVAFLLCTVLVITGIGWGLLMLDAWRLANPLQMAPKHRLGFGLLAMVLALVTSGSMLASASVIRTESDFFGTIFAGGGETGQKDGRYNVLLLGGDAGAGREGLRPDSMTVASIDAKTGQTQLFSLPRNMEDIEFPIGSPMRRLYPDKFTCPDHQCLLNAVYTTATEHKELYPGVRDPGAQATKEAAEWITGLDINYYALIDLNGFQALIDAVGGINVDVNKRVPIGGGSTPVLHYIEPGKNQHMNGKTALWFARSRHDSTDYERMLRQKCVMNAMVNQLDPMTVLTKFQGIAGAGKQIVETDVPQSEMNRFVDLALKTKQTKISSVAFVPPLIQPGAPDFKFIRETVKARIAGKPIPKPTASVLPASQPTESPTPEPTHSTRTPSSRTRTPSPSPTPTPTPSLTMTPPPGADTTNLDEVCHAA